MNSPACFSLPGEAASSPRQVATEHVQVRSMSQLKLAELICAHIGVL